MSINLTLSGLVSYFYASPAGIVLIAMRAFIFIWFTWSTYTTYRNYKDKRTFFCRFYVVFCIWIVILPIQAMFAIGVMPMWDRAKFVNAFERVSLFIAHALFMYLFQPGGFNNAFPFHAKTEEMADAAAGGRAGGAGRGSRTGSGSVRGGGRTQLSGGVSFGNPIQRVKDITGKLRYKLMSLQVCY